MLAVLLDPLSCAHMRKGLSTGRGGPAFYHALHNYSQAVCAYLLLWTLLLTTA